MNGSDGPLFPLDDITFQTDRPETVIPAVFGEGLTIRRRRPVGGGSINRAEVLHLSDGTEVFLKTNSSSHSGLFTEEARGLRALATPEGPRVPRPVAIGLGGRHQILLMEYIPPGGRMKDFSLRLGRSLAALHRGRRNTACGFDRDNHIGSTPQINSWDTDWYRFFGEKRLLYQVHLTMERGYADGTMGKEVEGIVRKLPDLLPLPDDGEASLLHGDLWGGNVMSGPDGEPVLIDPAVYYGHREADLAMTELFGGFGREFFTAYTGEWPLEPGYPDRRDIYNLYHLLNHLNLFGTSYLSSCRSILRRYA
jgi:protein-ribulosamine 3-kinase